MTNFNKVIKKYINILDNIIKTIRTNQCLKYCQGRILDIGCGHNDLVKKYGNGIGVDVFPWDGVDIICDTTNLPFQKDEFDRVFFIASLNHIPKRDKVLEEAFRVLKPKGMVIITMIGFGVGFFWHKLSGLFWDKDQIERGMKEGEVCGMSKNDVEYLLIKTGFKGISYKKFEIGLNTIYLAEKP